MLLSWMRTTGSSILFQRERNTETSKAKRAPEIVIGGRAALSASNVHHQCNGPPSQEHSNSINQDHERNVGHKGIAAGICRSVHWTTCLCMRCHGRAVLQW